MSTGLAQSTHLYLQLLPLAIWNKLVPRRGKVDALRDQSASRHQRSCLFLLRGEALGASQGGTTGGPTKGEGRDGGTVITVVGKGLGGWACVSTWFLQGFQWGRGIP